VATTDIDICARALILIGASPITSFDDGTTEATVAANLYEDTVRDCLSRHRWRFSSGQVQLSRLTAAPDARWDAAYQLPSDLLLLHNVTVTDDPIAYDRYQDMVYCNATVEDVVYADYSFRATEDLWPPYFVTAVQYQLASIFAYSVAAQEALSDLFEKRALRQMTIGRTLDSQSQTTRRLNVQRFNQVRTTTRGY
jgi:hypothetical protein